MDPAPESGLKDISSIQFNGESSDSSFEITVETLDLQIYSFRGNKNMPISAFKEEIMAKTGVPLEKQRLLYKGKVLKDNQLLSELNLKDGDTIRLVERQRVQPQSISSTVAADTSRRSSRHGAGAESSQSPSRTRSANSVNAGFIFQNRQVSSHTVLHAPWRVSSAHGFLPDALMTVSNFIDRMNGEFQNYCNLLNNDRHQLFSTGTTTESLNTMEVISDPEFLSIVLWRTEQLLSGNAATALSNLSRRLQRIDIYYDQGLRGHTQFAATQLGFIMQHLGEMFLELSRATLSLHIERSPGESFIQPRRAVFTPPTWPNPMMVEQFPHQSMHPYEGESFIQPRRAVFTPPTWPNPMMVEQFPHQSMHPYEVHYPFYYRPEQPVPIRPAPHFFGSARSTRPPSVSVSIRRPGEQATSYRTQSGRSDDRVSGDSENVRVAEDGNQSGSGTNNVSDLAVSRQVQQQVDLGQAVQRIELTRDPRNFIGEFLQDTFINYGAQNVYEDVLELSNVQFANEFMEVVRRYIDRTRAWDYNYYRRNGA